MNRLLPWLLLAAAACKSDEVDEYKRKSMMIEAKVKVASIERGAKLAFEEMGKLPVGKVGPAPAEPCCKQPDHKCPPSPDAFRDPIWSKLSFGYSGDESLRFQYSYESADGKSAVATAVGDMDCDGKAITYKLEMSAGADGLLKTTITEPTAQDD